MSFLFIHRFKLPKKTRPGTTMKDKYKYTKGLLIPIWVSWTSFQMWETC